MADFATKTGTGGTVVPNTYDSTPALTDHVPLTGKKETAIQDILDSIDDLSGSVALVSVAGVTAAGEANKRTLTNLTDDLLATSGVPATLASGITITGTGTGGVASTLVTLAREVGEPPSMYGVLADGSADTTTNFQRWLTANAGKECYLPPGTYKITSASLPTGTKLRGAGYGSNIVLLDGDLNGLDINSVANAEIESVRISSTDVGSTSPRGMVRIYNSNNCAVRNCYFSGQSDKGVYCIVASHCEVIGNVFRDRGADIQNGSDIYLTTGCQYCKISGNKCLSGASGGIEIHNSSGDTDIIGNEIVGNTIIGAYDYGIAVYFYAYFDSKTKVIRNYVGQISGDRGTATNKAFGSAIYIASVQDIEVAHNVCWDFCNNTDNYSSLAPAGIGLSGIKKALVHHNTIVADRSPCIIVNGFPTDVTIEENMLISSSTETTGRQETIYVLDPTNVKIIKNTIYHVNTTFQAIHVYAVSVNGVDFVCDDNTIKLGAGAYAIDVRAVTEYVAPSICRNRVSGGGTCLFAEKIHDGVVEGNYFNSSAVCLYMVNSLRVRFSHNRFVSASGYGVNVLGTCTGTFLDRTNTYSIANLEIASASGAILEVFGSSAPGVSGIHCTNSRTINTAPLGDGPAEWVCTVAGSPGTWTPVAGAMSSRTATQIADATNSINATYKWTGKLCLDTTNNRLMVATGATSTSAWAVVDGSATVTPA